MKCEKLDPPRSQPDYDMMDDVADWAVEHPEINRKKQQGEENGMATD